MDYRAFLPADRGVRDPIVLPFFGGTRVDAPDRRLRLADAGAGSIERGWWRFRIDGRHAVAIEVAPAADLSALPSFRGHWVDGWVIANGHELGRIALPPDDEPAPLARVTARRWYSGDLLFDTIDFEDDAELAARTALEQRAALADVRGVVPSLRAAFGYAIGLAIARARGLHVTLAELAPHVVALADGGGASTTRMFDELIADRERGRALAAERAAALANALRLGAAAGSAQLRQRARNAHQRADDALDGARARLLAIRNIDGGAQLDITYEVDGTRIMSIVMADSLQIIDPGICIYEERELTLDAMPSVIREAIAEGILNITRHA